LTKATLADGTVVNMTYYANGLRATKQVGDATHTYYYDSNGNIVKIATTYTNGNVVNMYFSYDGTGVAGFTLNGNYYQFVKNMFGDVTDMYLGSQHLAHYTYDSWGNCTVTDGNGAVVLSKYEIQNINPFRYRGYYYDIDLDLYLLQSRYYDSNTGRFIQADSMEYLAPEAINGLNLYAYCLNNPIMYTDPTGHSAIVIGLIIGAIIGAGIGFGTVAYTDHQDDGQIFNGSVKWYEYVGGTVTGAVLGAGVGGIIGAGGAVLTSAISSVTNKFISDLFAYTLTGTSFGTWEDYAVAFISGGLIKGLGMKGIVKIAYDVALRPAINQVVKIGTNRTETFNVEKYAYDVVTRGLTTLTPSPWTAICRGGFRSMWDLYKRGYFA